MPKITGREVELMRPDGPDAPRYMARVTIRTALCSHPFQDFGVGPTPTAAIDDAQNRIDTYMDYMDWTDDSIATNEDKPPSSLSYGSLLAVANEEETPEGEPWDRSVPAVSAFASTLNLPNIPDMEGMLLPEPPSPTPPSMQAEPSFPVAPSPPVPDRDFEMRRLHEVAKEKNIKHEELRTMAMVESLRDLDAAQLCELSDAIMQGIVGDERDMVWKLSLELGKASTEQELQEKWIRDVYPLFYRLSPMARLDMSRAEHAAISRIRNGMREGWFGQYDGHIPPIVSARPADVGSSENPSADQSNPRIPADPVNWGA